MLSTSLLALLIYAVMYYIFVVYAYYPLIWFDPRGVNFIGRGD
jgi:uncharacterized protein YggT (Ycf19 family)